MTQNVARPHRTTWRGVMLVALAIETPLFVLSASSCFQRCPLNLHAAMPLALFLLQLPGSLLGILADGAIVLSSRAITGDSNTLQLSSQLRYDLCVLVMQTVCLMAILYWKGTNTDFGR